MPQIPPITDTYIDEIIKAPDAYNPTLNKTQGVKLRELLKLMRDKIEAQNGGLPEAPYSNMVLKSSNNGLKWEHGPVVDKIGFTGDGIKTEFSIDLSGYLLGGLTPLFVTANLESSFIIPHSIICGNYNINIRFSNPPDASSNFQIAFILDVWGYLT